MATFRFFDGNQGFYRYDRPNLDEFTITAVDLDGATLVYNGGDGLYDPTRHPFRIGMKFRDAAEYVVKTGPEAGTSLLTDGELAQVRYFDDGGNLLLKVSGLGIGLPWLNSIVLVDDLWPLGDRMFSGRNTFIGSNDSSGPDSDWTGDDIQTGYGNDLVRARNGDDYIKDLGGRDKYIGGGGNDTVSYEQAFWDPQLVKGGIRADLARKKIVGFDGVTDVVRGIENVRGTFENDRMLGDNKGNGFTGYQGRDFFDGRGGFDWVSYRTDIRNGGVDGVWVNLQKGRARDGFGHVDRFENIEGAEGTRFDDTLVSSRDDNWLKGLEGADTFVFLGRKFGYDFVDDFDLGDGDVLKIGAANSMASLDIFQDGANAIVEFARGTIELANVDASDLDASAFVF